MAYKVLIYADFSNRCPHYSGDGLYHFAASSVPITVSECLKIVHIEKAKRQGNFGV